MYGEGGSTAVIAGRFNTDAEVAVLQLFKESSLGDDGEFVAEAAKLKELRAGDTDGEKVASKGDIRGEGVGEVAGEP